MTIEIKKPRFKLHVNLSEFATLSTRWRPFKSALPTTRYFMTVKNTPEGRKFIEEFRQMNNSEYRVKIRGRHSNRKQAFKDAGRPYYTRTQNDVPVALAERYVVYVDSKTVEIADEQYRADWRRSRVANLVMPELPEYKLV